MYTSLVLPAHNEERRLEATLAEYTQAFLQRLGDSFEVLVVANGCTDQTAKVATDFAASCAQVRLIDIAAPIGKGGAVLAGFCEARGQRIMFADADGATEPESLFRVLDGLEDADVVIGSRHMAGSVITRQQPLRRRIFSRLFNVSVREMFGLPYHDTQCGAKAFRRHAARQLADLVEETRWTFDVDLLLWSGFLGYRVREVPVVWADQPGSTLRVGATFREVSSALWQLKQRDMRAIWLQTRLSEEAVR